MNFGRSMYHISTHSSASRSTYYLDYIQKIINETELVRYCNFVSTCLEIFYDWKNWYILIASDYQGVEDKIRMLYSS